MKNGVEFFLSSLSFNLFIIHCEIWSIAFNKRASLTSTFIVLLENEV